MSSSQAEIRVGVQGRIVIPAEIRQELGIDQGETLVARVESNRLVLEKREAVLQRLQARFAAIPPAVSLVDSLIAERRAETLRE
jgi:AbrB family looped-hinge helix DNA binding protein